MEAGFKFGETSPFFVHAGVAGIKNPAKIKDGVSGILSRKESGPGQESGGKMVIAKGGGKGGVVGSDLATCENEKSADWDMV